VKDASRIGRDRDAEYPYFCAAAAHGSFRKAGKALAVQESSISRRVRDLEDRLGLRCSSVSMAEALCQGAHVFPTAFLASDRPVSAAEIMRRTLVGYR